MDTNTVRINAPHPRAYLVGAARDRARQRLATAIGNVSSYYSPPTELTVCLFLFSSSGKDLKMADKTYTFKGGVSGGTFQTVLAGLC